MRQRVSLYFVTVVVYLVPGMREGGGGNVASQKGHSSNENIRPFPSYIGLRRSHVGRSRAAPPYRGGER